MRQVTIRAEDNLKQLLQAALEGIEAVSTLEVDSVFWSPADGSTMALLVDRQAEDSATDYELKLNEIDGSPEIEEIEDE